MTTKEFCSISKYLQLHHKDLYHYMDDDLCVISEVNVKRNLNGSTFIIPSKAAIDAMKKLPESDAADLMFNYILKDYLPTEKEFKAKSSDIPNGNNLKADISDVKGNVSVNGVVIEPVKTFKPFKKGPIFKTNLAVWQVSDKAGIMKPSTKKADFVNTNLRKEGDFKKKPMTTGGYDNTEVNKLNLKQFINKVESEYATNLLAALSSKQPFENPYFQACASMLAYLKYSALNDEDKLAKYNEVLDHCDPGAHACFYILFGNGGKLKGVAEDCYTDWKKDTNCINVNDEVNSYMNLIEGLDVVGGHTPGTESKWHTSSSLAEAYKELKKSYEGKDKNILDKLGYDELRGIIQESFYEIENDLLTNQDDINRILDDVHFMVSSGSFLSTDRGLTGILKTGIQHFVNSPWCAFTRSGALGSEEWNTRKAYVSKYKSHVATLNKGLAEYFQNVKLPPTSGGAKKKGKKGGDLDSNLLSTGGCGCDGGCACDGEYKKEDETVSGGAKKKKKKGKKGGCVECGGCNEQPVSGGDLLGDDDDDDDDDDLLGVGVGGCVGGDDSSSSDDSSSCDDEDECIDGLTKGGYFTI